MEPSRNVEVKGKVRDFDEMLKLAMAASDSGAPTAVLRQRDTYFEARVGRLKLRQQTGDDGVERLQLVQYERPDMGAAKLSEYRISELNTDAADSLRETLSSALGLRADVKKTRHLFLVGPTRIHVDRVTDLGDFFELEVVLSPGETEEDGKATADSILKKLQVSSDDLISGSYIDLLLNKK